MSASKEDLLKRANPANYQCDLGALVNSIINLANELSADMSEHVHSASVAAGGTWNITHSAGATTAGTILYINPLDGVVAKLESTLAGSANIAELMSDSTAMEIFYAASPGGYLVYFDEDAEQGERFLINNTLTETDLYARLTDGHVFKFKHSAAAGTCGIGVYIDHDADKGSRTLFISPTGVCGTQAPQSAMASHPGFPASFIGTAPAISNASVSLLD